MLLRKRWGWGAFSDGRLQSMQFHRYVLNSLVDRRVREGLTENHIVAFGL